MLPVDRQVNRWRRPVDRPVDRRARHAQDHHGRPPGRPWQRAVDRPGRPTDSGRLTGLILSWIWSTGAVDRGMGRSTGQSTDKRVLAFLLGFEFFFRMGSNLIWVSLNSGTLWL